MGINFCKRINSKIRLIPGASPGFGRGGQEIFFSDLEYLHVAKRYAAHGEAMRLARGVRGMPSRETFFKWCDSELCVLVYIWIRFCL